MSYPIFWRQMALALIIFLCIALIDEFKTPWSQSFFFFYLKYILSDESDWDYDVLKKVGINELNLTVNVNEWREQASRTLQDGLDRFSEMLKYRMNELITRWKE